jgi:hypothetical protein
MNNKELLKAAGFPPDYKSEFETCKVTFACTPDGLTIGLDKELRIGNLLYIPGKYCNSEIPEHLGIVGMRGDLYKVMTARLDLVKPIPVGTELIIVKTAPPLINGKP